MKFIVSSQSLLKQLQLAGGVLTNNSTLPILDNFLFEIAKNELSVTASDLETTITTKLKIESKENGSIAVPAKLLMDTLKSFADQPLTFTIDDKLGIEISTENGRYKLVGEDAKDFPKVPELDNTASVTVNSIILSNAIDKTIFATASDELRPVMNGVFFELGKDSLSYVATDGHRLVKYTRKDVKGSKNASFIIPKKPLTLLKNNLGNIDTDVVVEFNQTNAKFSFEDTTVICRLIDGKYPNYDAVIPKKNPNKLLIDKIAFSGSLKRASIFSNKTTNQVRLKLAGSELNVSAEDVDYSNEANERLTCQYDGGDLEIGFNSKFLIEMLNHMDTKEIVLEMSEPNKAGIIVPSEKIDEDEDILMLVMPIMISKN